VTEFVDRHRSGGGLQCTDWERFNDPRSTTYASYVAAQRDKEVFVNALFAAAAHSDERLSPDWLQVLDQTLGTLCYPWHGLQMISAYIGSIAPSGKIVIASLFQSADEMRRVQRLTQRMCQLRTRRADLGERARVAWQSAPHWQPLRELIERLLVVYDFGEALTVLSSLVKPCLDGLFVSDFAELAREAGDDTLEKLLYSLGQDCQWQAEWSRELLRMAARESEHNRERIAAWLQLWRPRVAGALRPLFSVLGASDARRDALERRLEARLRGHEAWLDLDSASPRQEALAR